MIVNFDVKTDPNTDLILAQMRETQAASQLPADVTQLRRHGAEIADRAADADRPVLAERHVRREVSGQLRLHQSERPAHARAGHRQRAGFRRRTVRDAALGEARSAGQAATSRFRRSSTRSRRRTRSTPPARSAASRFRKGQEFTYSVRAQGRLTSPEEFGADRGSRNAGRRNRAREGCGARRAGRAGLQRHRPPERQAERRSSRSISCPDPTPCDAADGVRKLMAEAKKRFPAGPGLRRSRSTPRGR